MSDLNDLTPWELPELQLPTPRTQNDPELGASEEWAEQIGGQEYRDLWYLEMTCAECGQVMPADDRARLYALKVDRAAYVARRAPELAAEWGEA